MIILRRLYLQATSLSWLILTVSTLILIAFSAIILPAIEPSTFTSYADSLWFTMTTILTVGYGDLYPSTYGGRIFTVFFLYIIGIGLFASFIGKAFESLSLHKRREERGELMYKGKNHIVIIDWSHKAENAIAEILKQDEQTEIVVIDRLEKAKEVHPRIHYVKGNATHGDVLRQANVQQAKAVLIFADDRIEDQMLTDGKSLLIATAVERMSPDVYTTVEVEREEHLPNFSHVKVDKFIMSNGTIAKMAVNSIFAETKAT
ncbi:potassium channel family protein [Planococcus halotolerans]|uniref:Ion transporter n=1 Tax=Planococcus halotolerans TaxID=2233542 RepID=A0A365L7H8_9BACL|nr:potassium channel family protein [Planococcus halotolerans]QHJ70085.1 ion transporter [Planococcus halotolerans]RAZ81197.1 ion transporter [Planococcus halotolerans]